MSNIITPQIRFAGFTDAWEQRKLGDLIEENLKPVPKPDGEYTRLGIRSHAKGTFYEVVAQGEGLDVDTMYVVEANNLIVNITFAWEEAWAITTEKDAEKLVSHRFPQYCFNQDQCPMFYQYRFRNGQMKYNLELASPGGAGRNRVLNKTEFMKIPVTIPKSYEEQKEIGIFFSRLDDIITLHQRKCDALQKFKKSMLQKMFPKDGESVPEIRFAGFTDAWEQRKLSELFEERNEQAPMSEEYPLMAFIANIGVAPKGDRYDRSALVHDEKGKKYKRTEKGDFIYSSNNLETGSIGLNNYGNACISPVYSIFKSKHTVDPEFMGRILLRKEFINQMVSFRQGVVYGQWKIHEDDFLNLIILVPKTEEQQEIGKFFAHIDSLITLHQRKLETLQKMKKSLLQKMFV